MLLEGTPTDVDVSALRVALASIPGVLAVHDLHVWSLTSGTNAMSVHLAHIVDAAPASLLRDVHDRVREFNVQHSTVQLELPETNEKGTHA